MNTPALDKLLQHHLRTCTWHIYSGDRHCSCGLEKAREELQALKAEQQLPLFVGRQQGLQPAALLDAKP
jgi:hypothetical protein